MRWTRPVTVVVAAPGYGKTAAVRRALAGRPARWLTAGEAAGRSLDELMDGAAPLVLDGVSRVPSGPLPSGARLVLISRLPLAGPVPRWRARGLVTDVGPEDLALSAAEVAATLRAGPMDPEVVRVATAGWPALVQCAAAMPSHLRDGWITAARGYVCDVVLPALPRSARRLVQALAAVQAVTAGVAMAEDLAGRLDQRDGPRALRLLVATGLVRQDRLVPVVAEVAAEQPDRETRSRVLLTAASWHADRGRPVDGVRAAVAAADPDRCAELLIRHGPHLLGVGAAGAVVAAVRGFPPRLVVEELAICYADALYLTGDVDEAERTYAELAAGSGPLPAALAWRYGLVRYRAGADDAGLSVMLRGQVDDSPDGTLLRAWLATVYWMRGDADACARYAAEAYRAAVALGDDRCLAAAHVALALHAQLDGDRPAVQANYDRALAAAEAAPDLFAIVRIRTNRAASSLQEARYGQALKVIEVAVEVCDAAGYVTLLAPALCNEGTALYRLGRLDEAMARFERAASLYQRLRSERMAYALLGIGDVYRQRRRTSQARAAYEEAIRLASTGGDRQVHSRALAGLARVVAAHDPTLARDVAAEAIKVAPEPVRATALLAAGWAAAASESDASSVAAHRFAEKSAEASRRHRDWATLAEALELQGHVASSATSARQALAEALAIWQEAAAQVDADRVSVALAKVDGRSDDRVRADLAARRLTAVGVATPAEPERVRIETLGHFGVWVGGQQVPATAWQSRKARDLFWALVARRGRAVSRDELADLLWPGEPTDRVAHRLSVALSTVRSLLDPDRIAAPNLITADADTVALNIAHVTVDAELFADYARYGLDLLRAGRRTEAVAALEAAARTYTGDFLQDAPCADISSAAREGLRATFLQVARALADLARSSGRPDDAVYYLHRLLSVDRYDEHAHQSLIDLFDEHGRHGEGRRARMHYEAAMGEIDASAAPTGRR